MPIEDTPDGGTDPRIAVIVEALGRKGATDLTCSVCGNAPLELAPETFFMQALTAGAQIAAKPGVAADGIEVAALMCPHCGHLRLHHLPMLVRD